MKIEDRWLISRSWLIDCIHTILYYLPVQYLHVPCVPGEISTGNCISALQGRGILEFGRIELELELEMEMELELELDT